MIWSKVGVDYHSPNWLMDHYVHCQDFNSLADPTKLVYISIFLKNLALQIISLVIRRKYMQYQIKCLSGKKNCNIKFSGIAGYGQKRKKEWCLWVFKDLKSTYWPKVLLFTSKEIFSRFNPYSNLQISLLYCVSSKWLVFKHFLAEFKRNHFTLMVCWYVKWFL